MLDIAPQKQVVLMNTAGENLDAIRYCAHESLLLGQVHPNTSGSSFSSA